MSLVGTLIAGVGIVANSPFIQNTQYNKLIIKGQGIFDKVIVKNYAMSDEEFDAFEPVNHAWDTATILNAEFTNTLQGGALQTAGEITSWNLYRYCCGESYPDLSVIGIDGSETSYTDYTAVRNKEYFYTISPITSSAVVGSLQTNTFSPWYESWILLDPTTGQSLILNLNLSSGDIPQNTSVSKYEGFGQYPSISQSALNYKSGQIIAFLGYVDYITGEYVETIDDYKNVVDMITNGNPKLIKNRSGEVWKVFTHDMSIKIQDELGPQPKVLTFSYTEIGNV